MLKETEINNELRAHRRTCDLRLSGLGYRYWLAQSSASGSTGRLHSTVKCGLVGCTILRFACPPSPAPSPPMAWSDSRARANDWMAAARRASALARLPAAPELCTGSRAAPRLPRADVRLKSFDMNSVLRRKTRSRRGAAWLLVLLAAPSVSHLRSRSSSSCSAARRFAPTLAGVCASRSTRSMCTPRVRSQ